MISGAEALENHSDAIQLWLSSKPQWTKLGRPIHFWSLVKILFPMQHLFPAENSRA